MVEVDGKSDHYNSLNKDFGSTKLPFSDFFYKYQFDSASMVIYKWGHLPQLIYKRGSEKNRGMLTIIAPLS